MDRDDLGTDAPDAGAIADAPNGTPRPTSSALAEFLDGVAAHYEVLEKKPFDAPLGAKAGTAEKVRQAAARIRELTAEREWKPIDENTPRCVSSSHRDNGRRPLMVTRLPYVGHHAPQAIARLTAKGWVTGKRDNALWFMPTHWRLLPVIGPEWKVAEGSRAAALHPSPSIPTHQGGKVDA